LREARRLIAMFVDRRSVNPRMLPALAAIYVRIGRVDNAIEAMTRALEALGKSVDLLNAYGLLLASVGRVQESRSHFDEALRLDSGHPDALRNLAFAYHRLGERRRAYGLLVQGYLASPASLELRLVCATLLELDGHLPEAAACYRDVVETSTVSAQFELAADRLARLERFDVGIPFGAVMATLGRIAEELDGTESEVAPLLDYARSTPDNYR